MEINLANYVGQEVIASQRGGSVLTGLLSEDGPSPLVYKIKGRLFLGNGRRGSVSDTSDEDIVGISLVESQQNTTKDLLTLLASLTDPSVMKPPFHVRKKENGHFVLAIVEDIESDFGSRWQVVGTVVFSADGEVTDKGSTTLHDLLRNTKRAVALAKLTAEDREVLGL